MARAKTAHRTSLLGLDHQHIRNNCADVLTQPVLVAKCTTSYELTAAFLKSHADGDVTNATNMGRYAWNSGELRSRLRHAIPLQARLKPLRLLIDLKFPELLPFREEPLMALG